VTSAGGVRAAALVLLVLSARGPGGGRVCADSSSPLPPLAVVAAISAGPPAQGLIDGYITQPAVYPGPLRSRGWRGLSDTAHRRRLRRHLGLPRSSCDVEERLMAVVVDLVAWVLSLTGVVGVVVPAVMVVRRRRGGWNPTSTLVLFQMSVLFPMAVPAMTVGPLVGLWLDRHHLEGGVVGVVAVAVPAGIVGRGITTPRTGRDGPR